MLLRGHSAAELIRAHLGIGGALPQSAYVPVQWPFGSREYTLVADDLERIAQGLAKRAGRATSSEADS